MSLTKAAADPAIILWMLLITVLSGVSQRLRGLQADHERGHPAHGRPGRVRLLLRDWVQAELFPFLLIQVSQDGFGQEVRVIFSFIYDVERKICQL